MALSITCSGCDAVYPVGEKLIGKTIRCKKCGEMMPVTAPSKSKPVIVIEDDDDQVPSQPSRGRADPDDDGAPRKPSRRREESEDDEDESPRRPSRRREEAEDEEEAPKSRVKRRTAVAEPDEDGDDDRPRRGGRESAAPKSKLPKILGGLLTLLLVGGGIGGAFFFSGDDADDDRTKVALNDDEPKPAPVKNPEPVRNDAKKNTLPTKPDIPANPPTKNQSNTSTVTTPPEPTKTAVEPTKPAPPPPPVNNDPPIAVGRGANNGGVREIPNDISQLAMARVKRAAVFIKAVSDIGEGSGSGWIGIESDLVFTNAHVLFMKAPNSPEPKKMTFYLNAGTPDQIEIPHSKLKILAVDRDIDLAVVKIVSFPNLPPPLKIRPSNTLRDSETVYTIGFPLGSTMTGAVGQTKKEPSVSTRKTSYSGSVADDYGQIKRLKTEGGINPGNSGGAIVDANGDVVGVVVEMFGGGRLGNFIGLAVPTEYVNGLIAGRVSEIEYGIPYRDNGRVKVPVTAKLLNPFDKSVDIRVRNWIGDVTANYREPGNEAPKAKPGDANEATVELKYDPKTKTATGELDYPEAPAGRTYWTQPFFSNAITLNCLPGIKVPMNGPPVDRVATELKSNPKMGSRRAVTMSNSSDLTEVIAGEGDSKNEKVLYKTTLKVNEQVEAADRNDQSQAARLKLQFESINLGVEAFGGAVEQDLMSKKNQEQMNEFIKKAVAYGLLNRFGEMYRYSVNVIGVNDPLFLLLVNAMTGDALESLQATSIPMPNETKKPGETWKTNKEMRLSLITGPSTIAPGAGGTAALRRPKAREFKYRDEITYTYLGQRERAGRKEAVVTLEGKSVQAPGSKQTVTGSLKGTVWVEIDTGVVVEATIHKEFELDTSSEGTKKHVTGINDYKLTRGTAQ